jgi:hypothetical protein
MTRKLNQRERRILVVSLVAAVAIVSMTLGADAFRHWQDIRANLKTLQNKIQDIGADGAQQAALLAMVPTFETPEPEEKQKFLFRDKLHEQLEKAGIKTEPLTILSVRKKMGPYKVLLIKCRGKCKFAQLLDFLAVLKENPYLVGVEELRIQCDTKKPPEQREDVEIDLTVSTFVQDGAIKPEV